MTKPVIDIVQDKVECTFKGCPDPDVTRTMITNSIFQTGDWSIRAAGPVHIHDAYVSTAQPGSRVDLWRGFLRLQMKKVTGRNKEAKVRDYEDGKPVDEASNFSFNWPVAIKGLEISE